MSGGRTDFHVSSRSVCVMFESIDPTFGFAGDPVLTNSNRFFQSCSVAMLSLKVSV